MPERNPYKTPSNGPCLQRNPGPAITAARLARGWSLAELANQAGLHIHHLAQLENGSVKRIRLNTIDRLEHALRIKAGGLYLDNPAEHLKPAISPLKAIAAKLRAEQHKQPRKARVNARTKALKGLARNLSEGRKRY